ncbi:properdin [Melanerpes formicivorus]|uniref:properdin n=1 Tax=Melanerpes formicivorus TaxID=211600 RepID=UPI00358FBFAF
MAAGLLLLGAALLSPAAATPVWCFSRLEEDAGGGACASPLGSQPVPLADCCLNSAYGYKLRPQGHCHTCRPDTWGPWSPWSPCSVSCGEGTERRGRSRAHSDPQRPRREWQLRACELPCCPGAGGWSQWSPWGSCSVTCGEGTQRRHRSCTEPPPTCGGHCGPGGDLESRGCRDGPPTCPVGGSWGPWGPWGSCGGSCRGGGGAEGKGPTRSRRRSCDSPPPSRDPPGAPCPGSDTDTEPCPGLPPCPVDGAWGAWSAAAPCPVTCGLGEVEERRACDAPPPRHGGRACAGNASRRGTCGPRVACPVEPEWGPWSPWSPCQRPQLGLEPCSSSAGHQKRTRKCLGRGQGQGGRSQACPTQPGEGIIQQRACYNLQGCRLKGTWGSWSPWGLCSPPCGDSPSRNRSRQCEATYPSYPPTVTAADGSTQLPVTFWGEPKTRCAPLEDGRGLLETRPCLHVLPCPGPDEN